MFIAGLVGEILGPQSSKVPLFDTGPKAQERGLSENPQNPREAGQEAESTHISFCAD